MNSKKFTIDCRDCSRLVNYLAQAKQQYPDYYCKPVPAFGDPNAGLLIVGLAPGLHGANASGRPFTGDYAGILLYQTLYKFGFSNKPVSTAASDDLCLINCRITNAVKCVPPENKPIGKEIKQCNGYLQQEMQDARIKVILALGGIAHNAVLQAKQLKKSQYKFAHQAIHALHGGPVLLDSYHCSRYNTQTRRLTSSMFEAVFAKAQKLLN